MMRHGRDDPREAGTEVSAHLAEDKAIGVDIQRGSYAYFPSRWAPTDGAPIILLEKHH